MFSLLNWPGKSIYISSTSPEMLFQMLASVTTKLSKKPEYVVRNTQQQSKQWAIWSNVKFTLSLKELYISVEHQTKPKKPKRLCENINLLGMKST